MGAVSIAVRYWGAPTAVVGIVITGAVLWNALLAVFAIAAVLWLPFTWLVIIANANSAIMMNVRTIKSAVINTTLVPFVIATSSVVPALFLVAIWIDATKSCER